MTISKVRVEMYNETGNCISEKRDGTKDFVVEIYEIKDDGGWIAAINFRDFVQEEMCKAKIHNYVLFNQPDEEINWRAQKPFTFHKLVEENLFNRYLK